MTTPDFRALCAVLADCLDDALTFTVDSDTYRDMRRLITHARATLEVAPDVAKDMDESADRIYGFAMKFLHSREGGYSFSDYRKDVRAVLAHYGTITLPSHQP